MVNCTLSGRNGYWCSCSVFLTDDRRSHEAIFFTLMNVKNKPYDNASNSNTVNVYPFCLVAFYNLGAIRELKMRLP
jgi:hypothetical protein